MNKKYSEPTFKVVMTSAQDVLTASAEANSNYEQGQFETPPQPIV